MENSDTNGDNLACLSPKALTKKRRRLSVLSSKKYFRKSIKHDHVEYTIPKKSTSIIEISSTDSESFKSFDSSAEINKLDIHKANKFKTKDQSESDEIISPSPKKDIKNLKCLSTGKKVKNNAKLDRNETDERKVDYKGESQNIPHNMKEPYKNARGFLECTLLDYDKFRKPANILNSPMNSTMIQSEEIKTNLSQTDTQEKDSSNGSLESVNKSCEKLLDDLYGDSWRLNKEKILPRSEKKPPARKVLVAKQIPATESKVKKSVIYKNPYIENEKHKSNNLLKALHAKRIREAIESPFIKNLKELCEEESIKQSDDVPHPPKPTKLKFDASEKSSEEEIVNEGDDRKLKENQDFCWSDKENSLEQLSLKDRIERKKLEKEKNLNNLHTNENKNSKNALSSDENSDDMKKGKKFSAGSNSDSNNEDKKQSTRKLDKKHLKPKANDGNKETVEKKKIVRRKRIKKYTYCSFSSDNEEIKKEVTTPEESPSSDDYLDDRVKEIKKKLLKTKIETLDLEKTPGKKNSRKPAKNRKNILENSSDSDYSPGECSNKLDSRKKKTDNKKIYSFLASLSSNIPDSQCDPSAKIFKANFKNNKETLANKLYELYNENIFDNLLPKDVPLEWNVRMLCTAGYCNSKRVTHRDGKVDMEARIVLSTKVLTTPDRLRDTLIHEMCHAATWLIDKVRDGHGQYWKAWASKAKRVYPELPPIKTCHNYELSSKYVYKCTECGYEIKRHRKSLDIERKRCGYCCGKFEIFINKVNKKGEKKMVPLADTPKKEPKGFAAFYKQNYETYRTPRTTSAELMKILGNKFREMKVQ